MKDIKLDENHKYFVNGVNRPGFSEILESVGFPKNKFWTPDGRDEGTALSQWLLFLAKGKEPAAPPDSRIACRVDGIKKFFQKHDFQFVGGETPLFCPSLGFCVTPDIYGILDGVSAVVEAKRGARMKRHQLQTAAQSLALDENEFHAEKRFGLYLKDGDLSLELHDDDEDFEAWRAIVAGYFAKEIYAN